MYSIDQISNATAQLTGESLGSARLRLTTLDRFDELVPRAWADQALLESVLLGTLGTELRCWAGSRRTGRSSTAPGTARTRPP
ncbi:hypothetical protein [Streptomyces microflavus]|uniref:hypothetical protein n=1 Tax=Streptomyces microflavus TaxID=1919 RepID=UPI0033C80715